MIFSTTPSLVNDIISKSRSITIVSCHRELNKNQFNSVSSDTRLVTRSEQYGLPVLCDGSSWELSTALVELQRGHRENECVY